MFEVDAVRARFPALARTVDGQPAMYLDGPGGTQVPEEVIAAMAGFMRRGGSNLHGSFVTSRETDTTLDAARSAVADLIGASPSEVVFGQNMTSLVYAVSRAISRTWSAGDNVVVTRLDHDANVAPWMQAAADRDVEVRFVDFVPEDGCALDLGSLDAALDDRTRLVAFTHASNAVGTIPPVAEIIERAHRVGAVAFVDAVHYVPHGLVDVASLDADFLVTSAYKWFGPHTGCLYGKRDLLEELRPYKLRPSPDAVPDRWETGTQSFESLAGVTAAVDYLASLGHGPSRRERVVAAYGAIHRHERALADRFLGAIAEMPKVRLYGMATSEGRTPTFAIDVEGHTPSAVAARLGDRGAFVWSGDYYAYEVMHRLGKADGGLVRIGFVHYTTPEEVDRVSALIDDLA
jgi:cysteine desulfurase family protein (TIGR01976 family)